MTVAVRSGRLPITSENDTGEADSPSLLVYYLFDDWYSIYSLIAKSEHQYRVQLDKIRQEMFSSAKLEHVHKLHSIGRQLAMLKRMYEAYELIIERVINGPQQSTKIHKLVHTDSGSSQTSQRNRDAVRKALEEYGVPISLAATLRFERLADRIKLYALSEIKACLEEKESLMAMVSLITSYLQMQAGLISVELQSHCHQGGVIYRETDASHYLISQGYDSIHTCQYHGYIFCHTISRHPVQSAAVLDSFCSIIYNFKHRIDDLWYIEWYSRSNTHLQILDKIYIGCLEGDSWQAQEDIGLGLCSARY